MPNPTRAALVVSMTVSFDGFITDRDGSLMWSDAPSDEEFAVRTEQVGALGGYLLGRKLYETMLPWETDRAMRDTPLKDAFADVWCALPKVVFSRTLDRVEGNARLAEGALADEIAAMTDTAAPAVQIGGADLAAQALALDLIDEFWTYRKPIIIGGGTPLVPQLEAPLDFTLVESRAFGSRTLFERLRRTR